MPSLMKRFRNQFAKDKFLLQHEQPEDFAISQWDRLSPIVLLCWRLALSIWFITWIIIELVLIEKPLSYFLFMTHHSYLSVLLYSVNALLTSIVKLRQASTQVVTMSHLRRSQWVLFNIASATSLLVALGYWVLLYGNSDSHSHSLWATFRRVHKHGGTFLIMSMELFMNKLPHRMAHFIHANIFIAIYMLALGIYSGISGHLPYGSMYDYRRNTTPAIMVTIGMVCVAPLFGHLVIHMLYKLKMCLVERHCQQVGNIDELATLEMEKTGTLTVNYSPAKA